MLHIPSLQVLQYYTFLTAVVKCSTGVPLKKYISVSEGPINTTVGTSGIVFSLEPSAEALDKLIGRIMAFL